MPDEPQTLQGTLEHILFTAEDGYTVARLLCPESFEPVTVVGHLPFLKIGEKLRLWGEWTTHPKYGPQFKIHAYEIVVPTTVEGIQAYLSSGLIRGIGPKLAERLTEHFGAQTLEVIDKEPERLYEVPGLGPVRVRKIIEAWEEQRGIKEVMLFLKSHGVSTHLAVKIYKTYGQEATPLLKEDPYRLTEEIFGVGFVTADQLARRLGIAPDSPQRLRAGIAHVLREAVEEGHVYLPRSELSRRASQLLGVEAAQVEAVLEETSQLEEAPIRREIFEADEGEEGMEAIYLAPLYHSEVGAAERLRRLLEHPGPDLKLSPSSERFTELLKQLEEETGLRYSEEQQEALRQALEHKVLILTGGPGTGKTSTVRGMIHLFESLDLEVALASPTGRAAKRLEEATGRPAQTLHRLLEYSPQWGFQRGEHFPLEADVVIVDEASMIDLFLMYTLLRALRPEARLILVGDADQLPSVGPGRVLWDLIDSGSVPVVKLTEIFRQAQGSLIVQNAHRINRGEFPRLSPDPEGDFLFLEASDPQEAARLVEELVCEVLPERYGYHPIDEIQVLSPMYRGEAGVDRLNHVLQARLNPNPAQALAFGGRRFHLGDKVMQIRNDYDKEVFNGDIGRIVAVDPEELKLEVLYPGRGRVSYAQEDLDELVPAYAITVHKSQGSEYPCVVIVLLKQHYMLLQRNLLYTAVTRARERVIVVGSRQAIAMAVRNDRPIQRYTYLARRLRG
jgi:exodeoxyribonuclease V alpha subunit